VDNAAEMRDKEWSEMNHRIAGLFLLLLAGLALLQLALPRPQPWVRYGTLGVWLGLFVFLIIRSDPEYWPLGRINWLEGFKDRESCQHRLALALLIPLIVGDFLRLQHGWSLNRAITGWGVLALGLTGGVILFAHMHITIEPAHAAMVRRMNAEHVVMATAVLGLGVCKFVWDKWQVPRGWGQYLWLVCLGLLGLVLNLYVE
jgi:putative copper resistance protein D